MVSALEAPLGLPHEFGAETSNSTVPPKPLALTLPVLHHAVSSVNPGEHVLKEVLIH